MQRAYLSVGNFPFPCIRFFSGGVRRNLVCIALAAVVALGSSAKGDDDAFVVAGDGHMESKGLAASRQIMRHDPSRDRGEVDDSNHPSSFVGLMDMFRSNKKQEREDTAPIEYDDYHNLDAGPNCPMQPFLEFPTRYDKRSVLCINEEAKTFDLNCTHGDAKDILKEGENRILMAYRTKFTGRVNKSEIIYRWAKVFVPKRALTDNGPGLPAVFILHASIPLSNVIPDDRDKFDLMAPESHFDGLFNDDEQNPVLDPLLERVVTIVPAGYDRYRYDAPTCKENEYTAEFNYLSNTLGRTKHSNADDVKFFSALLQWLHGAQVVHLSEVYMTGHGAGGHMTFYMMSQYLYGNANESLQFHVAGGAASSSSFLNCLNDPRISHGDNGDWTQLAPAPFMYFQGLQDLIHWCHGGGMQRRQGEHMYTIEQMAHAFAERNGCDKTSDGFFRMKAWYFTPENSTAQVQHKYELWEFQGCRAPLVIYTFRELDHALKTENEFIFKQKLKFFLGEWHAPSEGEDRVLRTQNGRTICGCCKEMDGVCDFYNNCGAAGSCHNTGEFPGGTCDTTSEGDNFLQDVSCPGVAEIRDLCWCSKDAGNSPTCWWVTSEEGNDNPACN